MLKLDRELGSLGITVITGGSVYLFKKLIGVAALGCWGVAFVGLLACSDDSSSTRDEDGGEMRRDTTILIDPETGDTTYKIDSSYQQIDTSRTIDPVTGDTIIKIDTIYMPLDTTLHWVGNSALLITEVAPVNLDWLDENGDDPGWIEIYNAGSEAANLKGYALTESLEKGRTWIFGDELIAAKSFRTVFCDKNNLTAVVAETGSSELHARTHTNWKLEKNGGSIYLIDPLFGVRDSVNYPALSSGISWGIVDGGAWKYFGEPTPEKPNNEATAYDGLAPTFSFNGSQGGFYKESFTLNPPQVSDGLKVRCTQDGSAPTKDSPEFNAPITIESTTVLRCAAYKDGLLTKDVVTNTYFIGESVNMPVVAVSVDPDFFVKYYKATNGGTPDMDCSQMYAPNDCYPDDSGEMAAHVEYFENGSKSTEKAWDVEAGISLMGGWSRMERKKSLAVVMREEYGGTWLHYPLFETRKGVNDKYKGFNLRNNGNRFVADYFTDAVGGAILEGSGVDYQRSRQVVVFYNGTYYGIHDMRERFNKNFVETNYDIDASSVTFLKHLGTSIEASNGSTNEYTAMLEYAASHDFSKDNDAYIYMTSIMDMGNFANYMLAEMYAHNGDWPNNNVRLWKSPESPLWKFMVYDLDHGFNWKDEWAVSGFSQSVNMFEWVKQGGRNDGSCYTSNEDAFTGKKALCFHVLYTRLIKNPTFKRLFLNHAAVMLENYLNAQNVEDKRTFLAKMLDEADVARDMGVKEYKERRDSYKYDGFDPYSEEVSSWAESRDGSFLTEIKSEFGVGDLVPVTISSSGNGTVLMEGMKLPGSTSSSTNYTGKFFSGVQMELTAVPVAGSVFGGWSDGSTDVTHVVTVTDGMTITATFK